MKAETAVNEGESIQNRCSSCKQVRYTV
jgi:hypothetical protein